MQGKVAIITGGGGGIGRATAVRFAEEGAKVAVFDIDQQLGEQSAQIASAAARDGGGAQFFGVDVTDAQSVLSGVAATLSAYGEINTLHNNAGGSTAQDGPVTGATVMMHEIDDLSRDLAPGSVIVFLTTLEPDQFKTQMQRCVYERNNRDYETYRAEMLKKGRESSLDDRVGQVDGQKSQQSDDITARK